MTPDAIGHYIIALTALAIVCAGWAAYERLSRMDDRNLYEIQIQTLRNTQEGDTK